MDIIVGFFAGVVVSVLVVYMIARSIALRLLEDAEQEAKQEMQDKMFGINVEVVNDVIYCYAEDDNQFVCQGTTLEEIRTAFKKRFPNHIGFIAGGDPVTVEKLKEQIKLSKKDNEQILRS